MSDEKTKSTQLDDMWPVGRTFTVSFTVDRKGATLGLFSKMHGGHSDHSIDGLTVNRIDFHDSKHRADNVIESMKSFVKSAQDKLQGMEEY